MFSHVVTIVHFLFRRPLTHPYIYIIKYILFQLTIASQGSFDSKISQTQVFTRTGTYKGQVVAVKKFSKRNIDVTRSMKKEMKVVSKAP